MKTLTLIIRNGPDHAGPRSRTTQGGELSIGRGADNDWVLPDPDRVLSKRHCVMGWRSGRWYVADLSSNGTYLNGSDAPMGSGHVVALGDGDLLRLGSYVLEVRIEAARPAASAEPQMPADATMTAPPPAAAPHLSPEAPAPAAGMASDANLMAAFLRGARIEPVPPAGETEQIACMERAGAAYRAAVVGIRQTLMARAAVKGEFRIEQTLIRARGNNPLKFSASDDAAMASMVLANRASDLAAPAAMEDALRDMRLHELATMAAMQTAIRALLKRLDPAPLREEGEKSGGMIQAQRRARAFELYERLHAEISLGLADDFDAVFGRSFADAYEQALQDVSASGSQDVRGP